MTVLPAAVRTELETGCLTSSLYVTDIGCYPHAAHHYRHRPSGAEEYILIYCTGGEGWIEIGGKRQILRSGSFFIIPPGIPHSYAASENDPWSIYWIHFTGKLAPHFGDGMDSVHETKVSDSSRNSRLLEIFEELYHILELGSRDGLEYSSSILMYLLGSFKYIKTIPDGGALDSAEPDLIERCHHYMMENIEKKISVADICEYAGCSPSHCTTVFKRRCGVPPMHYLRELRIRTAVHLMEVSGMKINQICNKVGIEDPYHFSRLFRKTMGISPREYRRRTSHTLQ